MKHKEEPEITVLFLNKIESNQGWGAETFLNEALQREGVKTICVDYKKNSYRLIQAIRRLEQKDFDLVLLQRGTGYSLPLEVLKGINRPKILLFTELIERNRRQHYLLKSRLFEHIFVRSDDCLNTMLTRGWVDPQRISLMLSAFSKELHKPIQGLKKDIDVLFVGTVTQRRAQLISKISALSGITIRVEKAFAEDMVKIVNRAKIILNIHAENFLDTETRVYEVLACKGFLITEQLSSESPFINGKHLVACESVENIAAQIRYFLDNATERQKIAEEGYQHVQKSHSYSNQARLIKDKIKRFIMKEENKSPLLNITYCLQGMGKEKLQLVLDRFKSLLIRFYQLLKNNT